MMRAIIVDDEVSGRDTLSMMIDQFCTDITIVDMAHSAETAIASINKYKPDLLFLDIELKKGSGFDILDKIEAGDLQVIFTTAYNQYAIKSFKYNTIDYLLKPIDANELIKATKKAAKNKDQQSGTLDSVRLLFQQISTEQVKPKRISVNTNDSIVFLEMDEIVRMQADSNYTHIFTVDKRKITASKPLKDFEDYISDESFVRVHQSHLVNLNHVKKYLKLDGGYLVMSDDTKIEVSSRKKAEILLLLQNQ